MAILEHGYKLLDLPPISQEILASYDDVPLDVYMGNQTRYKRFSQYRLSFVEGGWRFDLLPHRAYSAFKKFNPVAGGILREYLPIEVNFVPIIKAVVEEHLPLDTLEYWQINVHQNRSRALLDRPGQLTPEGVHQDGHEFVLISVLNRRSVVGGEMRLWRALDAAEPFWRGTLRPGQAVLLDDKAVAHDVTDIIPEDSEEGHRDILIVSFSRWKERWYGDEHEQAALSDSDPSAM